MEKPKVKFSHNSESTAESAAPKKVNHTQEKGKIKVKSIVPINLPIKVLKNGKRLLLKNQENTDDIQVIKDQNVCKKSNSQHANSRMDFSYANDHCKEMDSNQLVSLRSETPIFATPINYGYLTNDEFNQSNKIDLEVQNCIDKLRGVTIAETGKGLLKAPSANKSQIHEKLEKSIPYIDCGDSDSDKDIKEVKVIINSNDCKFQQRSKDKDRFENQVPNTTLNPQQEDKENNNGHSEYCKSFHKIKATSNTDILKDTTFVSINKNGIHTKKPVKVQRKLQVMPCAKFKSVPSVYTKHSGKQVISHIKTRSLFNIAGKANNIVVQPGMPDILHNKHSKCNLKKYCNNKDIVSKNLLSRPEYNSAVCVMKNLKEIGEEKLVNDVQSLPATYRSLVHGKVSAALDFAPYESVYKNLIDLSVDDAELPIRLTRTKDPEPRNKDTIPSLSKFYNPKSTQEHFMSLDPKIFNPVSVNTLNAFTISNKICSWRISRDSF